MLNACHAGLPQPANVVGFDSLCVSVLYGFNSLGLVSAQPCRPFDVARNGLSLGEAAGFAILERIGGKSGSVEKSAARLVGYGESSDAYHMSAPHPQGLGALRALEDALARAGLAPDDIGYINLHGTATPANDAVEAVMISRAFSATTLASSTKGWTGHTLGAAGIVESVIALIALERGFVPGTLNTQSSTRSADRNPDRQPRGRPARRFARILSASAAAVLRGVHACADA